MSLRQQGTLRPISVFPLMTRVHTLSLPPALFSLCSPGVKHLELFLVQMLLSPVVLSYAALVHVVIEAAPTLE